MGDFPDGSARFQSWNLSGTSGDAKLVVSTGFLFFVRLAEHAVISDFQPFLFTPESRLLPLFRADYCDALTPPPNAKQVSEKGGMCKKKKKKKQLTAYSSLTAKILTNPSDLK